MRGVEDYLEQIRRLEEDGERITATVVARSLGVSLPSASEMLKRLAEETYLVKNKGGTIRLTPPGRKLAHTMVRRHRLVERLLTDLLDMPWHEVHGEADRLEHAVTPRLEERLAKALDYPEYCPHGHPICPVDRRTLRSMLDVTTGEEVGIAMVSEVSEEVHSYLASLGLHPGGLIKLTDIAPFGGPLTIHGESGPVPLGREVAELIQVCPPEEADLINSRAHTRPGSVKSTEAGPKFRALQGYPPKIV